MVSTCDEHLVQTTTILTDPEVAECSRGKELEETPGSSLVIKLEEWVVEVEKVKTSTKHPGHKRVHRPKHLLLPPPLRSQVSVRLALPVLRIVLTLDVVRVD